MVRCSTSQQAIVWTCAETAAAAAKAAAPAIHFSEEILDRPDEELREAFEKFGPEKCELSLPVALHLLLERARY